MGINIRNDPAISGGIRVNGVYGYVDLNGDIQFTNESGTDVSSPVENQTYAEAQGFFHNYFGKNELSVFDASFIKLRELVFGYTFSDIPFLTRAGIKNIQLSLVGRNLWLIHSNVPNIDPEYNNGAGNYMGQETAAIPSIKSCGFDLKVSF